MGVYACIHVHACGVRVYTYVGRCVCGFLGFAGWEFEVVSLELHDIPARTTERLNALSELVAFRCLPLPTTGYRISSVFDVEAMQ